MSQKNGFDIFSGPYFAYSDVGEKHNSNTSFLNKDAALELNKNKYAIAIIPNKIVGGRSNSNVTAIRSWFVDIDSKIDLPDLLLMSPLVPSCVVESKNGYHIYYFTSFEFPPSEHYINQQRAIVDWFSGDEKCVNFARLMRCPGFVHNKNEEPFDVKIVYRTDAVYSSKQIDFRFKVSESVKDYQQEDEDIVVANNNNNKDEDIYDKIRHYNSLVILRCLSGSSAIGFKNYRFKRTSRNHYNIIVDGKDSGCFINENGNVIGSEGFSGGAVEWLTWYGHSRIDSMKIIKEIMGWK